MILYTGWADREGAKQGQDKSESSLCWAIIEPQPSRQSKRAHDNQTPFKLIASQVDGGIDREMEMKIARNKGVCGGRGSRQVACLPVCLGSLGATVKAVLTAADSYVYYMAPPNSLGD